MSDDAGSAEGSEEASEEPEPTDEEPVAAPAGETDEPETPPEEPVAAPPPEEEAEESEAAAVSPIDRLVAVLEDRPPEDALVEEVGETLESVGHLVERIDHQRAELADLEERIEEQAATIEDLQETVAEKDERIEEVENAFRRKQADFENYKKRAKKRQEQVEALATEDLVERIVVVRDNLTRALEEDSQDVESLREGIEMTLREFDRILADEGVEAIEPAPGTEVDPNRHEVMVRVDSTEPEGSIAEVFTPGYEMADKVIQHAQVTVSTGELEEEPSEEDGAIELGTGAEAEAAEGEAEPDTAAIELGDGAEAVPEETVGSGEGGPTVENDGSEEPVAADETAASGGENSSETAGGADPDEGDPETTDPADPTPEDLADEEAIELGGEVTSEETEDH